jgi:hypothetical protein
MSRVAPDLLPGNTLVSEDAERGSWEDTGCNIEVGTHRFYHLSTFT